jgi:hypothetical protein
MIGLYRLAQQRIDVGYFAEVELVVELGEPGSGLQLGTLGVEPRWAPAIAFGVSYAYERFLRAAPAAQVAHVRLQRFHSNPVDTTQIVAGFVAAWAFWNAVRFVPDPAPRIDFDKRELVFPK